MSEPMNKVQRLVIAGVVAPVLRSQSERAALRPVKTYNQFEDPSGDKVLRVVPLSEVQEGVLRRAGIEFAVAAGMRPKLVLCEFCGKPVRVREQGGPLPKCCRGGCDLQATCAEPGCKRVPDPRSFWPSRVRRRGGRPWKCADHIRAETGRRLAAELTPELRAENARNSNSAMTSEQRAQKVRKISKALTPEQHEEKARKVSEAMRARTPEQRSEASRKAWATRRAKAEAAK